MVEGLSVFKEYFKDFAENYIISGGTACDVQIKEGGLKPRATKDIDIILVVEALKVGFVKKFWEFIEEGNYERKEKNETDRKYYRFMKPEKTVFPFQIELFSRNPDLLDLDDDSKLTPIPVNDDLTSLSAILLDENYYKYLLEHSLVKDSLRIANNEALICMKAKAFLDMAQRKESGEKIDSKNIKKHKGDVFRLAILLAENDKFELPDSIKSDMQAFVDAVVSDLSDQSIFKNMGLRNINPEDVFTQLKASFELS